MSVMRGNARDDNRRVYKTLDMWRGLAARLVVMGHASLIITSRHPALRSSGVYRMGSFGYLGVQLFFVISGYCIANSACSALGREHGWWSFIRARLRRIYPPCWFSLMLVAASALVAAALVSSGVLHASTLADRDILHQSALFYVSNLTLTQPLFRQPYLSGVFWTLCYEIAFYVIVSLPLIRGGRIRKEQSLLTILHIVTALSLLLLILTPDLRFYPLDLWPQFGLGVMAYGLIMHPQQVRPKLWMLTAAVEVVVFVSIRDFGSGPVGAPSRATFLVSLIFAFMMILLRRHDAQIGDIGFVKWMSTVGTFSYSLYLTHFLTIGIVSQALKISRLPLQYHFLDALVSVLAAVAFARLFYQFCERPFLKPSAGTGNTVRFQAVAP